MTAPVLADRLRRGEALITAWSALPEPLIAEAVARAGFDCVTLDVQHGLHDVTSVVRGIGAIALEMHQSGEIDADCLMGLAAEVAETEEELHELRGDQPGPEAG